MALRARRPLATASDVRAHPQRRAICAAFRQVMVDSNPRDGLFEAATPALHEVQRLSPNDSRNGSNIRALTALLESWVNDSRDCASPGKRGRDANKAPCGAGDQHNNRMKREGVSRCSHLSTGAATAPSGEQ